MSEIVKAKCPQCPRTDVSVVSGGILRAHAANSKKITPENPACPGSGGSPAGADTGEPGTEHHEGQAKCKVCRYPYPLTANGRIRTHLDRGAPNADGTQPNCPGGSDWPLGVEGISTDPTPEQELEMARRRAGGAAAEFARFGESAAQHQATNPDVWGRPPITQQDIRDAEAVINSPAAPDEVVAAAEDLLRDAEEQQATDPADDFLSGTPDPEPEGGSKGPWFESKYDGDCATCYTSFDAGDSIRAIGDRKYEAEDCCGDDIEPSQRVTTGARPVHVAASLQLPVKNGRYEAPHPETGKLMKWTRTTTFAEAIADSIALDKWKARMLELGLVRRPDLMENVKRILAGGIPYEVAALRRDDLDAIAEQAKLAAGSKDRAKKGTQLHKHTEGVESGRKTVADVPEEYRPDVAVYLAALEQAGFRPVPHLIERSVITLKQGKGVVGTFDRVLECIQTQTVVMADGRKVEIRAGEYVIGDVKSGAQLGYAWQEIQIQESIYAHGYNEWGVAQPVRDENGRSTWSWADPASQGVPRVREDVGIVMHMPYGEARSEILPADLTEGWIDARMCATVRERRDPKMPPPILSLTAADVPGAAIIRELEQATAGTGTVLGRIEAAGGPKALVESFNRPTAAQMATGHPSVSNGDWEARFITVRDKSEASALWKAAKAAGVPDGELKRLVGLATEVLKRQKPFSGPNGATPVPAAVEQPKAAPAPAEPPSPPTLEERAAAVTSRPEASAIFQEMKAQALEIGLPRIEKITEIMKKALAARV